MPSNLAKALRYYEKHRRVFLIIAQMKHDAKVNPNLSEGEKKAINYFLTRYNTDHIEKYLK